MCTEQCNQVTKSKHVCNIPSCNAMQTIDLLILKGRQELEVRIRGPMQIMLPWKCIWLIFAAHAGNHAAIQEQASCGMSQIV